MKREAVNLKESGQGYVGGRKGIKLQSQKLKE